MTESGKSPVGSHAPLSMEGDALLVEAAEGDPVTLERLRAHVAAGEPAAYAAGFLYFRDRRFVVDSRAYITDPELTHLIDVVGAVGHRLEQRLNRPLRVLEFGVGAGTLAITVKLEHPSWKVTGLDIDAAALEVAAANVREHHVEVTLLKSDLLAAWPQHASAPDLIFGDPPWGSAADLYADDRDAAYYLRMPRHSAFPDGASRCAIHDALIAAVRARGWRSKLILNYGVLPQHIVERSAAALRTRSFRRPAPGVTIVVGRPR